jgi:uncharacterized protein involved in outer membrane biogenesis
MKGKRKLCRPAKEKRKKVFPADPLPLDALKHADATIKFRAGQVILPQMALNDLTTDISLKKGHLKVKPLKATIGGGTLDGRLELEPRGKAALMEAELKVDRLDLGKMLKDLEVTEALEGNLDVDVGVKGSGRSVAALMAGLDGETSVVMGKGSVDNKYIGLLGTDLSSGVLRLLNPFQEGEKHTVINCFVSRFDIKDGLAKSTALVFDTSSMTVVGKGNVNLKTEKLDLSIKPAPKEGIAGTVGLSLTELAKPFKLGGTLAKPSLKIDPAQTALTIGKAFGGMTLFGPVGIVSALASGPAGDENRCLAAIEAAKKGGEVPEEKKPEEKKGVVEKTTEGVEEGLEGIGDQFKKLFGK